MAHTTKIDETIFIHSSDLSGDVTIKNDNGELNVRGTDITTFVLGQFRNELIRQVEQMDDKELKEHILKALTQ